MSDSPDQLPLGPTTLELSIVMPCLNEAKTLSVCIAKARRFLNERHVRGEIVVADNCSHDGSPAIAESLGARVVSVAEKGYGAALAGGIAAARGRFVIMADADDSYDFLNLMPLLDKLREGAQLVVGNRFKGGIKSGAMPLLNRYLGNPVLSFIGRLFFKIPLGDFHCGLRGFDRQAVMQLDLRTTGMEYASEMIVRASLCGLNVCEVPVTLSPDGREGRPHLHPWRDGWRHLRFLLLYSPRWLYLYPGVVMIVAGLLISALLLPGPLMLSDDVGLDVHTLLVGAMSLLVGVQTLTFGLMARAQAKFNGMIPKDSQFDKFVKSLSLEHLLAFGGVLLCCGVAAIFAAAHRWTSAHFGALDYRDAMRLLIFAATCVVGGLQIGFAAFLLGVMRIRHK